MPIKNILKSKKAISPILATLLLIVIAVAAIVVTYAWVMTYTSSTTQQAGVMLREDNVNFYTDSGTKKIDIYIKNIGTSDTKITAVYIDSTLQTTNPSTPLSITVDSTVKVTVSYDWAVGVSCSFKVSAGPQVFEFTETPQ
jgi:flagellin-like protein